MPTGVVTLSAPIEHLFAGLKATNPNFLWLPTSDETLLLDRGCGPNTGSVGKANFGTQVSYGGMTRPPITSLGREIIFPSTAGLSAAGAPFCALVLVDIPDPSSVTGCFLKVDTGAGGFGVGGGATDVDTVGNKLVFLRENVAWHVSASAGFIRGLNAIIVLGTNESVFGAINLTTGADASTVLAYNAMWVGELGIGGYGGARATNATVRAVAIWNVSHTNAEHIAFRQMVAAPFVALSGLSGPELFTPRKLFIPGAAAGGGSPQTVSVPLGSLSLTGFAPTVTATAGNAIAVPLGTLTLTAQTPVVTSSANQAISVPAGTLTLTANVPTVVATANQLISVPAGALTLTGQTPTVTASANQAVAVPLGTLTLTSLAPNVLNGAQQVVQVPLGTLTLTGQAPTVAVSANQVIAVPAGTLTLAGQTPTVVATNPQLISVPLGTLTLTGLVPTVSNVGVNNQISVPRGTLTMSGYTPIVRVSTDADVFIDRFAARSRITQSLRFGSRITTQVGLRSSLKD